MKVKPKEVLINLPVALLFDQPWEIASFAANVNTILHGKTRLKVEELGELGGRSVGLFYLNRNDEYHEIRGEFVRLIEEELIANHKATVPTVPDLQSFPEDTEDNWEPEPFPESDPHAREEDKYAHKLCDDCDDVMLHVKGQDHCVCGDDWSAGKCKGLK